MCGQELAERYAPLLCLPAAEVEAGLESIRGQAVKRGKGNKTFRETNVATLELLLPRDSKKVERAAGGDCPNPQHRNGCIQSHRVKFSSSLNVGIPQGLI